MTYKITVSIFCKRGSPFISAENFIQECNIREFNTVSVLYHPFLLISWVRQFFSLR